MSSNLYKSFLSESLAAGTNEAVISVDRMTNLLGETISTSDFATFARGIIVINPDGDGQTSTPEYVSFTGISGTTFTGCTRGLSGKGNTSSSSNMKYHPVGTPVVISFGVHELQDLIDYIDDQVAAVTIGTANVVLGTAGETITAGQLVYLKNDGKWWKTDADTAATVDGVQLGIAQGAGSADGAITNGVMLRGLDTHQSGLVAGTTYYASNTAGGIGTSAGTNSRIIGVGRSTTTIYFNPEYGQLPSIAEKAFVTQIYAGFPGIIMDYAGSSVPTGWLDCDGSAVSRTTYAALFAAISTTWGVGDGSTTFNLPDLRDRQTIGAGTAATKVATFVSRSSNVITVSGISNAANNEFQTGQAVLYSAPSGAMTGLTDNTTYYLVRTGNLTFSLASSLANAQNGTVISLSSNGTGTQTFTLTLTARTLGHTGGEENHAMSSTELLAHTHATDDGGSDQEGASGSQWGAHGTSATGSTGSNSAMNNMQPFAVVKKIIKY